MFRNFVAFSFFFFSLFLGSICHAGLYDNPNVAIMPFKNKAPVNWDSFGNHAGVAEEALAELLTERPDVFNIVDREDLSDVVGEQYLGKTGLTAPSDAVEMGGLLSAEYKVYGSVTGLTTKENHVQVGVGNHSAGNMQHNVYAHVTIKVVEVKTGRVVLFGKGKGESTSTHTNVHIDGAGTILLGTVFVSEEQAFNAINKATRDAVYGKDGIFTKMGYKENTAGGRS